MKSKTGKDYLNFKAVDGWEQVNTRLRVVGKTKYFGY